MSTAQQAGPVYALLADGSTVQIRPAEPGYFDAVKAMHEAMSPDNAYFRFFILSRTAVETEAWRICQELGPGPSSRTCAGCRTTRCTARRAW